MVGHSLRVIDACLVLRGEVNGVPHGVGKVGIWSIGARQRAWHTVSHGQVTVRNNTYLRHMVTEACHQQCPAGLPFICMHLEM